MADEEWVTLRHTSGSQTAPGAITREAYETFWKDKGWSIVGEESAPVEPLATRNPVATPARPSVTGGDS